MHVVRQRKRVAGDPLRAPRTTQAEARPRRHRGSRRRRQRGRAYGTTTIFGENKVGQEYSNGLQISSDQVLKPLGDRLTTPYGKFMGSTVSPDGRFLVATSNDRSVALQVFDLSTYKLIWRAGTASGVDLRLSDNTVGQEGPVYSPDGKFLYMPNATGITRFSVNPDGTLAGPTKIAIPTVDGKKALTGGMAFSRGRQDPVRRRQRPEQGGGDRPDHRPGHPHLGRRHRPAPGEARRRQAVRHQRGRPAGDGR